MLMCECVIIHIALQSEVVAWMCFVVGEHALVNTGAAVGVYLYDCQS